MVVECRGKKEDDALELEFRRLCDGENRLKRPYPFTVVFADKKTNSAGLQLADLVARPIGLHILNRRQNNRAFDVLQRKFYCSGGRRNVGVGFDGFGLKVWPKKTKSPDILTEAISPTGFSQSIKKDSASTTDEQG